MDEIRAEVLAAYGGRCVWCACDDLSSLEIDHLGGQGNAHRRLLRGRLESWLKRQGYPAGVVHLLCRRCHNWKSGRMRMPPKKGNVAIHLSLDEATAAQVDGWAAAKGQSRSQFVQTAIESVVEGLASEKLLTTLHARLDAQETSLRTLQASIATLQGQQAQLVLAVQSLQEAVTRLYDAHATPTPAPVNGSPGRSWLRR